VVGGAVAGAVLDGVGVGATVGLPTAIDGVSSS